MQVNQHQLTLEPSRVDESTRRSCHATLLPPTIDSNYSPLSTIGNPSSCTDCHQLGLWFIWNSADCCITAWTSICRSLAKVRSTAGTTVPKPCAGRPLTVSQMLLDPATFDAALPAQMTTTHFKTWGIVSSNARSNEPPPALGQQVTKSRSSCWRIVSLGKCGVRNSGWVLFSGRE